MYTYIYRGLKGSGSSARSRAHCQSPSSVLHGPVGKRNVNKPNMVKSCCRYAVEYRCEACHGLQWPSYQEVATGLYTLPSMSDFCQCASWSHSALSPGNGEALFNYYAQCDGPDGNTHCVQQPLLDALAAGNMELQASESNGSECVTPSCLDPDHNFLQPHAASRSRLQGETVAITSPAEMHPFLERSMPLRGRGRLTQLHETLCYTARWRGSWEPIASQGTPMSNEKLPRKHAWRMCLGRLTVVKKVRGETLVPDGKVSGVVTQDRHAEVAFWRADDIDIKVFVATLAGETPVLSVDVRGYSIHHGWDVTAIVLVLWDPGGNSWDKSSLGSAFVVVHGARRR